MRPEFLLEHASLHDEMRLELIEERRNPATHTCSAFFHASRARERRATMTTPNSYEITFTVG